MKKFLAMILAISMIMSVLTVSSFALEAKKVLEGEKTAEHIDGDKYGVTVKVPGGDGETRHDDVILMVDGSYSGDDEWPEMKEAINAIGSAVLNGNGNTQLTLMAFGMGDNYVLEHIVDARDLAAALGELPGNLLRGVSSTNCEAGFTGVKEFVETHEASLKDAIVIFISDGGINTDETPRLFYYWQNYAPNVNTVINYALDGVELPAETTKEEKIELVNKLWKDVFDLSGMDINGEYPISEMERAFIVYVENGGSMGVYYSFLMAMKRSKFDSYPNVWNRTYNSVFDLAKVEDVKDLYLVRYANDGRATWMPDAAAVSENDNIHYVKSDSISTLTDALEDTLTALASTPFNDVVVTDYMSKWVNLLPETIKVTDAAGNVVADFDPANSTKDENGKYTSYAYKWVGNPHCKEKAPIVLDLVPASEYAAGGADVIGNKSGDIYKITWNLKDGALYRHDAFALHYEVTADVEEPGFKYDVDLPANGNTDIEYTDENGEEKTVPIRVPEIIVRRLISDAGKIVGKKLLDGAEPGSRTFSFLLTNTETGETAVATNDRSGRFEFDMTSLDTGIYYFTVEEINEGDPDYIYDTAKFDVTVIIDGDDVSVYSAEDIVFENETFGTAHATINGYKYLDGELADGFTFVLEDDMGNIVDTATSEGGEFEFNLELDEAYTHIYHIYELNENEEGIVYDDSVFEVRIDVERAETAYTATVRLMGVSEIAFYNETIPEETTEAPEETTEAPEETTEVPEETTEAPEETTEAPEETTEAPEETTEAPEETTEAPEETTEAPEETTEAPEETTEAPEETTEAPEETTEAPEVTTEPEEEITEEPTPLDPTPETTEPEEEITDPEIPLDPNPKTGDSAIILVIVAIAVLALAALYIKRRQVIED